MKIYSETAKSVVHEIIDMFDVERLVQHAMDYVSVYVDVIYDYVLENIEDAEELTLEELEYLREKIEGFRNSNWER
jgi:hypothetical protein